MIEFTVKGDPKPQPRARAFLRPGAKHAGVYNPPLAEAWKLLVYGAAKAHVPVTPMNGPIALTLRFTFERPASHYGTGRNAGKLKPSAPPDHLNVPDLDNLEKAIKDLMTNMRMWVDDRVVNEKHTFKEGGAVGGLRVVIESAEC